MTSILSAFPFIGEQSFATPGAFNSPLSTISANIAAINADVGAVSGVTITPPSGNTIQMPSDLSISGYLSVGKGISIGTQAPGTPEPAALTIGVNSGVSDYLYLNDVSNLRSDYLIGSHAGGTADGLNIFDVSGNTMLVTFSKQSVRFWQKVVGAVFDTGGQFINVKGFGALGDGLTNDTGAIQNAIDSVTSRGGTVFFPGGIYPNDGISITTNNTTLLGDGVGVSILSLRASANTAVIRNTAGVKNIHITTLSVNGTRESQSAAPGDGANGISINNAERVYVDNVQCFNTYTDGIRVKNSQFVFIRDSHFTLNGAVGVNANGIDVTGDSGDTGSSDVLIQGNLVQANAGTGNGIFVASSQATGAGPGPFNHVRISVIGNIVVDPYDVGIELKQCQQFTVVANVISGSTTSLVRQSSGIYIRQSSFGAVTGNYLSDCQNGIVVDTNNYDNCFGISVTGNSVLSCSKDTAGGAGIKISAKSSLSCDAIGVTGNVVDRSGKFGVLVAAATAGRCTGISLTGNVVSRASFAGIYVDTLCRELTIAGNVCSNNGANTTDGGFGAGIAVTGVSGNLSITGNRCFDDQGTKQQDYGINIDSNVSNVLIADNVLHNNAVGALRNVSSGGSFLYGFNMGF